MNVDEMQNRLETAMETLAAINPGELFREYLTIVMEAMKIYKEYQKAENQEEMLKRGEQLIDYINFETEHGTLMGL